MAMQTINKTELSTIAFSNAIEAFFHSEVESIVNFKSCNSPPFIEYHIDFMLESGMPGTVELACVIQDYPIYQIRVLGEDEMIFLLGNELEIIRPYKLGSMTNFVNYYRTLLDLYSRYESGEIRHHTNEVYLDLLIMHLRNLQVSIEDIAVSLLDKKKFNKNGSIEGLIQLDSSKRFPHKQKDENVTMNINKSLTENILFN